MAGRKSFKEEIQVVKYMTELAPKTFAVIKNYLEYELSEDATDDQRRQARVDRKWAVEQMVKLLGKAIPQAGDTPENPIYQKQITGMEIVDGRQAEGSVENQVSNQEPQTA